MSAQPRCIVIGASAGGLAPLTDVVSKLPAGLAAPVLIASHVDPAGRSLLPQILSGSGALPAKHPDDGEVVRDGVVYIAPPDHHLLTDGTTVAVKRGPKENGFRPSIDALFRSAAYTFGPNAIGVVLSGSLSDGTSGLWSIKRLGGVAVIQDPDQARFESMPRSALEYVDADYKLPSSEIGTLLARLVDDDTARDAPGRADVEDDLRRLATEAQVAAGTNFAPHMVLGLGSLSPFTCPECHGILVKISEGSASRFRCHTGHGFTEEALLEQLTRTVGEILWRATRGLQETEMLLEHMGRHLEEAGHGDRAKEFLAKAHEIGKQASHLQMHSVRQENLSGDNVAEVSEP